MSDADDSHAGVASRVAVGGQLFQMRAVPHGRGGRVVCAEPGLLTEFTRRRRTEILIGPDESARQRPPPLERRFATAYHQRAERVTSHREDDQVDGDGEGREGRRVVARHAEIIVVFLTINTPFATPVPCPAPAFPFQHRYARHRT